MIADCNTKQILKCVAEMRAILPTHLHMHGIEPERSCFYQACLLEPILRQHGYHGAQFVVGYAAWRVNRNDPQAFILADFRDAIRDATPQHGWVDLGDGRFVDSSCDTMEERMRLTTLPGTKTPEFEWPHDCLIATYDDCIPSPDVRTVKKICYNYERSSTLEIAAHILDCVRASILLSTALLRGI